MFVKRAVVLVTLLAVLATGWILWGNQAENLYLKYFGNLPKIQKIVAGKVDEIKKEVNVPPPLQSKEEAPDSFLTAVGVIRLTNIERQKNGLPALSENTLLDESAQKKVQDMFAKQYFEHVSPDGLSVSDVAGSVGYQFIVIGENLALGNFSDDAALVTAWMNSEGHRANILNTKYKEIGVAVMKGTYQGKTTWMAVQHFGKPLSDCPQIDASLEQKIADDKSRLDTMNSQLAALEEEIRAMDRRDPNYNQKVEEYNNLANQYNSLTQETKQLVETYNSQVANFNQCAS